MSQDININVWLRTFKGKATSPTTHVDNKKAKTSSSKSVVATVARRGSVDTGLSMAKKALPGMIAIALAKGAINKTARPINSFVGARTNQRLRQRRTENTLDLITNPIRFGIDALKFGIINNYEVQRINKQVDYDRLLSGNYLPYTQQSGGLQI